DDWTWMTARWMTRWKPAVGFESSSEPVARLASSVSMYSTRLRRSTSRSTLQARMTAAASLSSISARSRCSSVAYSWWRSLAKARAWWRAFSRLRENDGTKTSLLFHHALQRVLMLAGEVHDLCDLGLRHFVRVDAALPDTVLVHMQHDPGRFLATLLEEALEHMNDELHRSVVVIEQEHAVQARPLRLRPCLGDDAGPAVAVIGSPNLITHLAARQ